ncbi:peptidyl-tRNA hydrolase 2, putative [Entamoeba invadens IP1]|uniref:peptidyl-tRNA hydrolase n=1 Tax=Entamoeba invadens IP1 TaxID=370355 RepID=A0A0A1TY71_ENTIV|nr:peptidyl-tRNA hydrolase 2, putative [Entamoeba invadens IP1]ELP86419.1 peptidyl-tRNA hydrolase 2, putative [Entamoeba invadens IP1]|eukprot:XP_004185765.1 peptidyl-tRNA hydrolase 2, putative [Entamoeba invadens IP1]
MTDEEYKMMLCVRTDISMSEGKKCAQCGHAAVCCYELVLQQNPTVIEEWKKGGMKKVAVRVESLFEWENAVKTCQEFGIVYSEIVDAGRTEVSPNTKTVLGIGPAPSFLIDVVTRQFRLL